MTMKAGAGQHKNNDDGIIVEDIEEFVPERPLSKLVKSQTYEAAKLVSLLRLGKSMKKQKKEG